MRALGFLLRSTGTAGLLMAPIGLASAAFSAGFVATIHRALGAREPSPWLLVAFIVFGAGRILVGYFSGTLLGSHTQEAVAELRRNLIQKLLTVPYLRIARAGLAKVQLALTHDLYVIENALESIPTTIASAAIVLGAVAYLAYLSPIVLGCVLLLALPCALLFRVMFRHAREALAKHHAAYSELHEQLCALTDGAKELRMNAARRKAFVDGAVFETLERVLYQHMAGRSRYLFGQAVNQGLVLAMLGGVLFVFPLGDATRVQTASGFVLVGLYLLGPLAALARAAPTIYSAELVLRDLDALGVQLHSDAIERPTDARERPSVRAIELRAVRLRYSEDREFALGPISLRIEPGEIVFVTGKNGSGKSTLGRLLCGLYAPDAGEVLWDDAPVTDERRDLYRQLWSSVFADPFVQRELFGLAGRANDARALLERFGLARTITVEGEAFSSIELSTGQKKRLALVTALLEDRPLCMFDEWAAEQDPDARRAFYEELLPELKARGKAVVVMTHDDRYFAVADRLLPLMDGKILGEP